MCHGLRFAPGPRKAATDGKSARSGPLHVHLSWLWGMQVGLKGAYDCVKAVSEIDMTEDLGRIEVPTLIIHSDDDHSRRRRPDRAHQ